MTLLLISSICTVGIEDESLPCSIESESVCCEQSRLQFHCYICFVVGTRGYSTPHGGPSRSHLGGPEAWCRGVWGAPVPRVRACREVGNMRRLLDLVGVGIWRFWN